MVGYTPPCRQNLGNKQLSRCPTLRDYRPIHDETGWCSEARLNVTRNYARAVDIVDGARTLRLQKKAPAEAGAGIETRIELKNLS